MKLFDLTSGFIAAALILLGNFQSVEKPQVQDKPLVKETTTLQEEWFVIKSGDPTDFADATNPANYELLVGSLPCDGNEFLCAIKAIPDYSGSQPRPTITGNVHTALEDYLEDSQPADSEYIALKNE